MRVLKEKLPSGAWRVRVEQHDGRFVTIDTYDIEADAEAEADVMRELLREKGVSRRAMTVGRWVAKWSLERKIDEARRLRQHVIADEIADIKLRALNRRDLKAFLGRLAKRKAMTRGKNRAIVESDRLLAGKTQREIFVLLRCALADADDEGLMHDNPSATLKLPKASKRKAFGFVYPDEDAQLLACEDVPFAYRFAYGFLAREGLRKSELLRLTWSDLDLERGILILDENKSDDPRSWALQEGTRRALVAIKEQRGDTGPNDRVIVGAQGRPLNTMRSARFRSHLRKAGISRPELFATTRHRQAIRLHDQRATFVTLSLADGQTERWVQDRTGHTTNAMIQRYHRMARTAAEVGLGSLLPLDEALGLKAQSDPRTIHGPRFVRDSLYLLERDTGLEPGNREDLGVGDHSGKRRDSLPVDRFVDHIRALAAAVEAADDQAVADACLAIADEVEVHVERLRKLVARVRDGGAGQVAAAVELLREIPIEQDAPEGDREVGS